MLAKRIIPCLDMRGRRVVTGVDFVDNRDAGVPVECAEGWADAALAVSILHDGKYTIREAEEYLRQHGVCIREGGHS